MNGQRVIWAQPVYILKITVALALMGAGVAAAYLPAAAGLPAKLLVAALIVASVGAGVLLRLVYKKMDELQKIMHHSASVATLSALALGSAVIGILQANGLMPMFSQFWAFGMIVAVWGLNLMAVDRCYK